MLQKNFIDDDYVNIIISSNCRRGSGGGSGSNSTVVCASCT